jgi:hypothetical protein
MKRLGGGPGSEEGAAHSGKKLCRDLKCLVTWLFINPGTLYFSSHRRGTYFHNTDLKFVCVLDNKNIISNYHKSLQIASLHFPVFRKNVITLVIRHSFEGLYFIMHDFDIDICENMSTVKKIVPFTMLLIFHSKLLV